MTTDTLMAEEVMTKGFPRPRLQVPGYENGPAPYVAASVREPGVLDLGRCVEVDEGFLCAVCGVEVTESRCGIATGNPVGPVDIESLPVEDDHGLTHEKCARLTVAWCPSFANHPDLVLMAMWMVDTASVRACWDLLPDGLTLGMLSGRERLHPPAHARRPWVS